MTTVCIESVRDATPDEWDAAWRSCSYSTYFHSREWAEVWADYTDRHIRPAGMKVTFSDGASAVLPLSVSLACGGALRRYLSSPAGTYGGWISEDNLERAHASLLADYMRRRCPNLVWRLNPYDPLIAQIGVGTVREDNTHAFNLSNGFNAVFSHWSHGHQSSTRKAVRERVVFQEAGTQEEWRAYYEIYQDCLRRWGTTASSRYEWPFFEAIRCRNSTATKLWLARREGAVIAGALCFYAPKHLAYWHGAVLENCLPLGVAVFLVYETLKRACAADLSWYDFNPSGGHEGVQEFKRRFSPLVLSSPVIELQTRSYGVVSRCASAVKAIR